MLAPEFLALIKKNHHNGFDKKQQELNFEFICWKPLNWSDTKVSLFQNRTSNFIETVKYLLSYLKVAWSKDSPPKEDTAPAAEPGDIPDGRVKQNSNGVEVHKNPATLLSPRPPSAPPSRQMKHNRPGSSYGVRSYSPWGHPFDDSVGRGYYSDMDTRVFEEESVSACDEEELLAKNAVHTGDRVMIQSHLLGEKSLSCFI